MLKTRRSLIARNRQITTRIDKLCYGLDMNYVNPIEWACHHTDTYHANMTRLRVTQKVVAGVYQGVTTVELDVSSYIYLT